MSQDGDATPDTGSCDDQTRDRVAAAVVGTAAQRGEDLFQPVLYLRPLPPAGRPLQDPPLVRHRLQLQVLERQ